MILRIFLLAIVGFFIMTAYADDSLDCPATQAADAHGQAMYLWEHVFTDGSHDLVITNALNAAVELKRVTFGGRKEAGCHYVALTIAQGGDWGWHLAWFDTEKARLYYARMDGSAWVSSPPRHWARQLVRNLKMLVKQQQVSLTWQADGKPYKVTSDDEGRSWSDVQEID